jgi:hypothetical protein
MDEVVGLDGHWIILDPLRLVWIGRWAMNESSVLKIRKG